MSKLRRKLGCSSKLQMPNWKAASRRKCRTGMQSPKLKGRVGMQLQNSSAELGSDSNAAPDFNSKSRTVIQLQNSKCRTGMQLGCSSKTQMRNWSAASDTHRQSWNATLNSNVKLGSSSKLQMQNWNVASTAKAGL